LKARIAKNALRDADGTNSPDTYESKSCFFTKSTQYCPVSVEELEKGLKEAAVRAFPMWLFKRFAYLNIIKLRDSGTCLGMNVSVFSKSPWNVFVKYEVHTVARVRCEAILGLFR
jgi:hypothetical protein